MKHNKLIPMLALAILTSLSTSQAQTTAFTYQGQLNVSGSPANGLYDFKFQAYDALMSGSSVGGVVSINAVGVTNGLFTALVDLGATPFTGPARWLQMSVRTNGNGAYMTLLPREPITPTPYAIFAANAGTLGGQSGSAYVAKAGDTMTGALNLPSNGLNIGGNQLVANSGNIGIGTTSPEGTLSLFNSSSDLQFKLEDRRTATSGDFLCKQTFYDYGGEAAYVGLRHNLYLGSAPRAIVFGLSGSEKMRISNDGKVGIGTTSPLSQLHVVGPNGNYSLLGYADAGVFAVSTNVAVSGLNSASSNFGWLGSSSFGVYGGANANATSGVLGINSWAGVSGELGKAARSGEFGFNSGVYGHGVGDFNYAGYFDGNVYVGASLSISGGVDAYGQLEAHSGLRASGNQGYVLLESFSSANGSVLELRNDTASPSYFGAINFTTPNSAPGQIAYESDNALHFRTGGVDDRMKLSSVGLYVNGTFVSSSDRNLKENFKSVNALQVLDKVAALPVTRWNYKQDTASEHIGPMAQDFYAAFTVGPDDKHITTIDESGVALAAIQGLNQKVEEKNAQIRELTMRLEKLEQFINTQNGGGK